MDTFHNEEIEEIIDEVVEEITLEEDDSAVVQRANLNRVGKKPLPPKSKMKSKLKEEEEEEEEEELAVENKYAGLYKDGTGKSAFVPEPIATDGSPSVKKQSTSVKMKKAMREELDTHMNAMFDGEELSEDFKTKASTIFESALNERVEAYRTELQEEFSNRLVDEVDEIKTGLTEQLDSYLSYVVEEWIEENRLVVEKGIRTEITEEFMQGLRNLFIEHDIVVPEGKVDLADQLAETVETLKDQLNEELHKNISLNSKIAEFRKAQILDEASGDLADTQKQRFALLAEGLTYNGENDLRNKMQIIKESYFNSKKSVLRESQITLEEAAIDEVSGVPSETLSESMTAYSQTLSRLNRR